MPLSTPPSDAELVSILKLIRDNEGNVSQAARASGRSRPYLQEMKKAAESRGLTAETPIRDDKFKMAEEIKGLKQRLKVVERDNESSDEIRKTIYGLASRTPEPPEWILRGTGSGTRGVPMAMWSDWHRGEVVRPEEVAGVNEFNSKIHDQRVKRLVETTIDLAFNHMGRAKASYPGIIVCLGGDFINGDIHDELIDTSDRTTQQNINELTDVLAGAIEKMASAFGKVFLPCVVGNHGRASLKPRTKGRVHTSHEWNLFCNLERYFRSSKHVNFVIPGETDVYFSVFGHRYLLTHGDSLGVKGGDGIIGSVGPIMRGSIKVGRSEAQIGRDFDTIVMGHWHQALTLPGIIVNNSLKGYDEFARLVLRAPYSRPSQQLWFTHPSHGITAHWQVYLEKMRNADSSNEWVSWQKAKTTI